jgi:hypothetical protein
MDEKKNSSLPRTLPESAYGKEEQIRGARSALPRLGNRSNRGFVCVIFGEGLRLTQTFQTSPQFLFLATLQTKSSSRLLKKR